MLTKTDFIEEYSKKRKQLDENYIKKKIALDNDYKEDIQKLDNELEEKLKKWNELKKKVLNSLDKFELKPKGNFNDFCSLNKTISHSSNLYNSPINVIEDSDSSYYEEQKENQKVKVAEYKNDSEDDRYKSSDESYDEDFYAERETQSQSAGIKSGLKKFKEDISESVS